MMKTTEVEVDAWVVDVVDERDVAANMPGYKRRFTFTGPKAADNAWACFVGAESHGFKVQVEKVKHYA